jgi:adenylosuccinate lyase
MTISPLDGRYKDILVPVEKRLGEDALILAKTRVELDWLIHLSRDHGLSLLDQEDIEKVEILRKYLNQASVERIKQLESQCGHDIKAIELYLREALDIKNKELIHFGLTSEDINNIALRWQLDTYIICVQIPQIRNLMDQLIYFVNIQESCHTLFPTRTHGQLATPTTFAKEIAVYLERLYKQYEKLENFNFDAKLSGSTGTYAALSVALPNFDSLHLSKDFIEGFNFNWNIATTQVDHNDSVAEYLDITRRITCIIKDFTVDIWLYLSYGDLIQSSDKVGSSVMPHKINPIAFENAEGNCNLAISLLSELSRDLPISRMQRDLSNSTITRNIGVALSHSYLALQQLGHGLKDIIVNPDAGEQLYGHDELLGELYQTVLRIHGYEDAYEKFRAITQGQITTRARIYEFVSSLEIDTQLKERLLSLDFSDCIVNCEEIYNRVLKKMGM